MQRVPAVYGMRWRDSIIRLYRSTAAPGKVEHIGDIDVESREFFKGAKHCHSIAMTADGNARLGSGGICYPLHALGLPYEAIHDILTNVSRMADEPAVKKYRGL